ncbi:hypothetical protein HP572_08765 [Pectobacterium sp. PL64]|uniref:hypothetical protein n=1 Tax=Pectobacterium sp. PL64 TaxID=2738983 RepID=UPI001F0C8436|nr:hypothetical protein [Pectobacterium sp. PL64]UMO89593.1 hypothetical protein HP572_08765 [Pectobacterium sp. PL64]
MMLKSAENFFRACEICVSGNFVEIREDEIYPGVGVMNFLVIDHDRYGQQEIFIQLHDLPFVLELELCVGSKLLVPVEVWQESGAAEPYLALSSLRDIEKK